MLVPSGAPVDGDITCHTIGCDAQVLNGTIFDAFYLVGNSTSDAAQERLRQIALNGQAFAARYLCHRARALYWQRLLQEYRGIFGCVSAVHPLSPSHVFACCPGAARDRKVICCVLCAALPDDVPTVPALRRTARR